MLVRQPLVCGFQIPQSVQDSAAGLVRPRPQRPVAQADRVVRHRVHDLHRDERHDQQDRPVPDQAQRPTEDVGERTLHRVQTVRRHPNG